MKQLPDCLTKPAPAVPAAGGTSAWVEVLSFIPDGRGGYHRRLRRGWIRRRDYETGLYLGWRFVALAEADELPK